MNKNKASVSLITASQSVNPFLKFDDGFSNVVFEQPCTDRALSQQTRLKLNVKMTKCQLSNEKLSEAVKGNPDQMLRFDSLTYRLCPTNRKH